MNQEMIDLAKSAGFVFWDEELHGPGPQHIDWSCDYSREFKEYTRLIIEQCASFVEDNPCFTATDNLMLAERLRISFGVDK